MINKLKILFIIIATLPFSGCGDRPTLNPLEPDATILAFGDSLTHGTGATNDQSYPAILEQLINRRVINAGIPGEVTAKGLARLPDILDQEDIRLVILTHGGNDMLRKKDLAAAAENMRNMIKLTKKKNIDVVLIGVPKPGLFMSPADFYAEIAEEFNLPYESDVLPYILIRPQLKSDAIHPNAQGYALMAKSIAELLQKYGAL